MNYARPLSKTRAEVKKHPLFKAIIKAEWLAPGATHPIGASKLCGSATD